ncbi:hypothetical protein [Rosenbergiella collisarenosi]|uniref:hypothetical protein n=1 Tax=Rosenbergiella collisarenosi TaxID=1544695 RepID=UPI001F4F35EE|nr:hypothetical protein [Rosenbergiella collisarenosi]
MRAIIYLIPIALSVTGCSHKPYGRLCSGEVSTLTGQVTGHSQAWVFDEIQRFTITKGDTTVHSGYLHSTNPALYVPSTTTKDGFLAQRLSNDRFRLADAHQDSMVTWTCPVSAAKP